jgi:hypothetical protein
MAIKTFTDLTTLPASDINTYLANSGLVYVTSGALSGTAVDFVGCFTSEFTNYRIVIDSITSSAGADVLYRLLQNTTPITTTTYSWAVTGLTETGANVNSSTFGQTQGYTGWSTSTAFNQTMGGVSMDIYAPLAAQRTFITTSASGYAIAFYHRTGFTHNNESFSCNGIRFLTNSGVTFTGNVSIYGYRKP